MKKSIPFLFALLIFFGSFLFSNSPAYAVDSDIPYALRVPYKIVRGVTNVCLGWTEILVRPIGEYGSEGVLEAMGTGVMNTMIRFSTGIQDVATFWVPDIQMLDLYPDWEGWPYLFHWS